MDGGRDGTALRGVLPLSPLTAEAQLLTPGVDRMATSGRRPRAGSTSATSSTRRPQCRAPCGRFLTMQCAMQIKPGTVKGKIKESRMPFTCMELIGKYIQGCEALGMRQGNLFRPPDLYEKRVSYPKANNNRKLSSIWHLMHALCTTLGHHQQHSWPRAGCRRYAGLPWTAPRGGTGRWA